MKKKSIKVIGFDADDTLWVNEPYYRETEDKFCKMLHNFGDQENISKKLLETEIRNIDLYGYGTKSFLLSLIETAITVSDSKISASLISKIIDLGKSQLKRPNDIIPDVRDVLEKLSKKYLLIVATKGDLLDQEKKLINSGLLKYFHHIEIMSDKKAENYKQLFRHLDINPDEFFMIGNSIKSDILPVIELGGNAIHIPFHTTWVYEEVQEYNLPEDRFMKIKSISEVLKIF